MEHTTARLSGAGREAGRAAFTIAEFCDAHRISRSKLYELWTAGVGPRFIRIGTKKIITTEAAANWRQEGENSSARSS